MDTKGIEELFGRIGVETGEVQLSVDTSDPAIVQAALQDVGHGYLLERDQKRLNVALETGAISLDAARRLAGNPTIYRNWFNAAPMERVD